jgi:hypothetical protein
MKGDLPNYHLIVVSYMGATNSRGSRMKLTSLRFGDSVLLSYDYSFNQGKDQAIKYLHDTGFDPIGAGYDEKKGDSIIICKTFNSLKETKLAKKGIKYKI